LNFTTFQRSTFSTFALANRANKFDSSGGTFYNMWLVHVIRMEDGNHPPFLLCIRSASVYAVVRDRGAQYRVEQGQTLDVALMDAEPGTEVVLDEVLLVGDTADVKIGAPLVANARVVAEVVGEARGEKIIVFKYKRKKRYRRRTGHRQDYTRLAIKAIEA
jgi:large subunit ribosomal protein L21